MSADLRRLAEAATPGPWRRANETAEVPPRVEPHRLVEQDTDPLYSKVVARTYRDKQHEAAADAAFIAAASPDRILALLAERDALLAVAEAAQLRQGVVGMADDLMRLGWAVGLFEGEGCIVFPTASQWQVCLQLRMTDEDVVRRFQSVVGFGYVTGPYVQNGHLPQWNWRAQRPVEVASLLDLFLPMLGERRSAKAMQAMDRLWPRLARRCVRGHVIDGDNALAPNSAKPRCKVCVYAGVRRRHLAREVRFSPLTSETIAARERVEEWLGDSRDVLTDSCDVLRCTGADQPALRPVPPGRPSRGSPLTDRARRRPRRDPADRHRLGTSGLRAGPQGRRLPASRARPRESRRGMTTSVDRPPGQGRRAVTPEPDALEASIAITNRMLAAFAPPLPPDDHGIRGLLHPAAPCVCGARRWVCSTDKSIAQREFCRAGCPVRGRGDALARALVG